MAKKSEGNVGDMKVVRILRTVPIGGVVYRADQLVSAPAELFASVGDDAYDASEAAIAFRKSEGAEVIEHGAEPVEKPAAGGNDSGEGEIVD